MQKISFYRFSLFLKINFFFSIFLAFPFLLLNSNYTIYTFLLTFFGLVSTIWLIYFLYYLVSFPLRVLKGVIFYISALFFFFLNISIILDFFIYKIYHYHINAMVLNILFSPEAFDSIQFGKFTIVMFVSIIITIFLIELLILKYIKKGDDLKIKTINKKLNYMIFLPIIFIVLIEKIVYGYHSIKSDTYVLTKFRVIPGYLPFHYSKFAKKYLGIKPKYKVENNINIDAKLNYPLKTINSSSMKKINIFIFAFDAVRNSDINKKTAPNVISFSKDAYRFESHYSGGNSTRFGIFSLFYGLNSTYWFNFLAQAKGPILFDLLKKEGYNFFIGSSTSTKWPEFYKTVYVDIQDSVHDDFLGVPWQKDKQVVDMFISYIDSYKEKKPIFSFIFLDAPHGYSYPSSENIFKAKDEINYLTISKDSTNMASAYSSYKNAIFYDDKLFAKMINHLKKKELYKNSLIIFTSDHGQEFFEYGYFGHSSAFTKAQTNSVLIIKPPKDFKVQLPKDFPYGLTSHTDVVPTIFKILNIKTDSKFYSNGYNIFDKNYHRDYVFCASWNYNAIMTKKYSFIFSNIPNKMFNNEIRENKTYKLVKDISIPTKFLTETIKENSKFLK